MSDVDIRHAWKRLSTRSVESRMSVLLELHNAAMMEAVGIVDAELRRLRSCQSILQEKRWWWPLPYEPYRWSIQACEGVRKQLLEAANRRGICCGADIPFGNERRHCTNAFLHSGPHSCIPPNSVQCYEWQD